MPDLHTGDLQDKDDCGRVLEACMGVNAPVNLVRVCRCENSGKPVCSYLIVFE